MTGVAGAHLESVFETEIAEYLAANGWLYSPTDDGYDRALALFPEDVLGWVADTQPAEYTRVVRPSDSPAQQEAAMSLLLKRLAKVLDNDPFKNGGTLQILRGGFSFVPPTGGAVKVRMAQFRPATTINPATLEAYGKMRLRVMRQVHYSAKNPHKALDLLLFVNGLPVATVELKTDFTQPLSNATKQYQFDRNPAGEPLLGYGRRALVHFAVSNSEVAMTTRLAGAKTRFLPFNQGNDEGAGNPLNPKGSASAYFWEQILQRDTWLRIVGSFMHTQVETEVDHDTGGKTLVEKILFPRYHQWRAVTRLVEDARTAGPGHRYLIQHWAGSGKTNSISWLAHQLSQLHDANNQKVFDTVVVVTDRTVLDKQLRDAIAQFEHHAGVVKSITGADADSKSAELAEALVAGKQIVIVTIQTFEALIKLIDTSQELQNRRFAVIVDEAHSSQTGSTAGALTKVLSPDELAAVAEGAEVDSEAYLQWAMTVTAHAPNISYFAFTATPKAKTLELFGTVPDGGTLPEPFDLYSMQQAIEEQFILDVLTNYTPYKVAWQLQHPGADYDQPGEVDESTAVKALVRFVRLHPTNISQKAKIVVDHFRTFVQPLLDGKAKAMVVTGSRKEAVRWKKYLDAYLADAHIVGVKALVAFSGTVDDPDDVGEGLTEKTQNPGLWTSDLAEAFKPSVFNVMIVAEKFQTGFDQPRLVAMYVDKKLGGVQAVQTLSRLNRTFPGKDKTFVLDFVNDPQAILEAFLPYYRKATLTATTDPNLIYDLKTKLDSAGIYDYAEVEQAFDAALTLTDKAKSNSAVSAATAPAVHRFDIAWTNAVLDADQATQDELKLFKSDAGQYVKFYDFISQARNLQDTSLPRLHYFLRRILPQLSAATIEAPVDISQVQLTGYTISKGDAVKLTLDQGPGLDPITAIGSGTIHEKHRSALDAIIAKLNERFGDKYGPGVVAGTMSNIVVNLANDQTLADQAEANTSQQFAESPALPKAFISAIMGARDQTPLLVDDIFNDTDLFAELSKALPAMLYEYLHAGR